MAAEPLTAAAEASESLAAQLRDIHPGPALVAPDPRIEGWVWLLIILLMTALIGAALLSLRRYRRWQRQIDWEATELVPQLQDVLRQAALGRWPEARTLQGDAWLAFLDHQGGSRFSEFSASWPQWLYGQGTPDARQRETLRRAYLRWGRVCISRPSAVVELQSRWQRRLGSRRDGSLL